MNNLDGKHCPYCKSKIKQGEDIIVCSECGMPHHKECWIENNGCTTFGCLGTIDTPKIDSELDFELTIDDFDMTRCSRCNRLTSNQNQYCEFCGNLLYKSDLDSKNEDKNKLFATLVVCLAVIIFIIVVSIIE